MSVDWSRILSKAERVMETPNVKKKVNEMVDNIMLGRVDVFGKDAPKTPEDAAFKLIEVLHKTIKSCIGDDYANGKLSELAYDALYELDCGKPYRIGDKYYITVYFNSDLHRDSIVPEKYDGIDNIAALLNNGYSANDVVFGIWEKHNGESAHIMSLMFRDGANFMQQSIADFMGNYASEYNVTKIELSDEYGVRTD